VRGQIRLQDHEGRRAENSLSVRLAAWKARRRNYYDERLFQGRDRIYIPVDRHADPDLAELRERIESRLGDRGYADIDYEGGYCCDRNGNKVKLGKTLRKFEPDLYDRFQRDPTRGEPHYAVISRKPSDIARMSSGRGWRSCMAVGGPYWDQVPPQIAKGVVVAYLVRESDPDIHDPLARLLAKPFEDKRGDVILEPDRAYGMSHRGFSEAVRAHLDRTQNLGLTGKFYLRADIYTDDLFPVCHRHPDDPRAMPEQPAKAPKAPAAPGGFQ